MAENNYSNVLNKVNTYSNPANLKITDMKLCKVNLPPWGCWILKLETNQGICGFGEVRDGASPTYLKMLKSRLIGENPCNVEKLFNKIKQFGGQSRQSGGVCAVELALWDLAGKAYGVPVYQFLGGKYRDNVRLYADIHIETGRATGVLMDPKEVGKILKGLIDRGFTALKILSVELIFAQEGNFCGPLDYVTQLRQAEAKVAQVAKSGVASEISEANGKLYNFNAVPHPFTNMHVTEQGLDMLEDYISQIRDVIGYKVPLAIDHFGHFPLLDMIKIARRLEKFNLAWLEDMLPWYLTEQYKQLKQSTTSPIATGEDIFLSENFEPLLAAGALDLVHPDMLTCGGIMETKKLGDLAAKYGASMAVHMCESPIASLANAHMAVATENFFALEHDALDSGWWEDIIIAPLVKPIEQNGFTVVSDAPGLGIEDINADVVREHGPNKGKDVFISTDEWDDETSLDRIWS